VKLQPRLVINLTAVLVLAVVTVSWAVFRLAGPGGFEGPFRVTADFESSGGVFTNQQVTYRGVLVGKVGELSLNDDGVNIELLISPEWKDRIPRGVEARIGSKSAVGEQFVNLTPSSGGGGNETLSDGDVIPRNVTSLPVDFQELLQSLDRVLADVPPEATRRLAENLAAGLGGREDDIATILRSLGTLADTFASVADEQQRLLDSSTEAGREFLRTKDNFAAAIRAADRVFEGIGERPEELRRLFVESDRFARNTNALLARHRRNLSGGIRALADFVSFQLSERNAVIQSLRHVPQFLKAIEEASIPWRAPDGRRFYRLRVGLVVDDVPASWPCKYQTRDVGGRRYERHYFQRDPKRLDTRARCAPRAATAQAEREMQSLLAALRQWAEENPDFLEPREEDGDAGSGSTEPAAEPGPWTDLVDRIFEPPEEEVDPETTVPESLMEAVRRLLD
jgi:phospholipid/cholesterol/gamma-HCH transport system substrate-binding protein